MYERVVPALAWLYCNVQRYLFWKKMYSKPPSKRSPLSRGLSVPLERLAVVSNTCEAALPEAVMSAGITKVPFCSTTGVTGELLGSSAPQLVRVAASRAAGSSDLEREGNCMMRLNLISLCCMEKVQDLSPEVETHFGVEGASCFL